MSHRLFGILLALTFFGWMSPNVFAINVSFFPQKGVMGKRAWDFTLPTVTDKTFTLSESIAGKKAIIFFGTTWCPYCRKQFMKINSVYKEITKKEIVVVFVNVGESKASVKKYLSRNRYDFDVVMDYKESLGELYPFAGIPALFFVDEKGVIKALLYDLPKDYHKFF
ncbi:MAG: TlpA family protein disulfide reductase [Candidatus Omnitrophica bacterium]|nr:TlpA family protein disulfide reductase [Candidatus Omnitrophota bacterium]